MTSNNIPGKQIRLSRSIVGSAEADAASRVITGNGYLGMGAEVDAFETALAEFLGIDRSRVVCVNSGTAALHLAVEAVTSPGDAVLVQSLTYVATFQAISGAGARPIACEVNTETVAIDLMDAERRIDDTTRAIMPVHYAGSTGDRDAVYRFAEAHHLRVIEDAAHAFGSSDKGRLIGTDGDIFCFSFDGIKNITSGEGGAVITADPAVAERIRDARLLGVARDTEKRFKMDRSWDFDVHAQGYRYHMSDINAAIGRVQLKRLEKEFAEKRRKLVHRYREKLVDIRGLRLLETFKPGTVPHIMPVRILDGRRNTVKTALNARGIQTGIHYKPNHLLTYYGAGAVSLPRTEGLYDELLSLPLHPGLAIMDIDLIVDALVDALGTCVEHP